MSSHPDRTCTKSGRVVYDREPTPFKYRDIHRIIKTLDPPYWIEDVRETWYCLQSARLLLKQVRHGASAGRWLMRLIGTEGSLDIFGEIEGFMRDMMDFRDRSDAE